MNIKDEIKALKEQKNAVILAHYYVADEIQEIADYVGDSFALSKTAATLPNPIIVYCGVSFMGESGCLLSPEKKVLMPDASADCPMAHMVTKAEVDAAREAYEDLAVVCYINSGNQILVRRKRDFRQRGTDCPQPAQSEYPLYPRSEPRSLHCRAGA